MSCLLPPSCSFCEHYLGEDETQERECKAFKEIPDDILTGVHDHTTPYSGDHDFLFKLKEETREDYEEVQIMRRKIQLLLNEEKTQHQSSIDLDVSTPNVSHTGERRRNATLLCI